MVRCAVSEAKNKNIEVVRSHSSSQAALNRNFRANVVKLHNEKYKKPLDSILKLEYTNKL